MTNANTSQSIVMLNDVFRTTLLGGQVMLTAGVQALPELTQYAVFKAVQTFNDFSPDNDPYGEHDFGVIKVEGQRLFWKIG